MKGDKFTRQRARMVEHQIEARMIRDAHVLKVMRQIPRHKFIPRDHQQIAYQDRPAPIGEGQTISQPYIVALMTEMLELTGDEIVLEVGTGSGYQAAVLAALCKQVYTIERHPSLAQQATRVLGELEIENVTIREGDGSGGWPEHAPYDAIMVTAAAPVTPQPLLEQLNDGGRMIVPVGGAGMQRLILWRRKGVGYRQREVVPVSFVPLRGEHGYEKDWY